MSAITCGYFAARICFAGTGIELVARQVPQGRHGSGGHWLPWSNNLLGCVLSAVVCAFIFARHAEEAAKAFDTVAEYVSRWSLWWLNFMLRFIAPAVFFMIAGAIAKTDGGIQTLAGPLGRIFGGHAVGSAAPYARVNDRAVTDPWILASASVLVAHERSFVVRVDYSIVGRWS